MIPPVGLPLLRSEVQGLAHRLQYGCGNHGCRIRPVHGMGTNSICQCTPVRIARELLNLAEMAESMGHEWPDPDRCGMTQRNGGP
jgi:hypothetical protein